MHRVLFILPILVLAVPCQATEFSMEVSGGLAAPIGTFIDGYPAAVDNVQVDNAGTLIPGSFRFSMDNDPGYQVRGTLLFDQLELSYDFSRHTWGAVVVDGISFRAPDAAFLENVFLPFDQLGMDPIHAIGEGDNVLAPLYTHRFLLGYRFLLWDSRWRPYVPVATGFTIMDWAHTDLLLGGTFEVGTGVEYMVLPYMALGVDLRYSANLMQNPAIDVSGIVEQSIQGAATKSSVFETVIEVQQLFLSQFSIRFIL